MAGRKLVLGLVVGCLFFSGFAFGNIAQSYGDRACSATREFVSVLEYLRSVKEFSLPEADARKTADDVARSCTGSARRFISVAQTLLKAGLSGKDALNTARELAARSEGEARSFVGIFRLAFLEDGLDLDLMNSMRLARELSVQFAGESAWAYDDFRKVVEFCMKERGLDLPKGVCGVLAARIAKKSEIANGGVASDFIRVFHFARDAKRGVGTTTGRALEIAEEVAIAGPDATDNFVSAFKYAMSTKGLGLAADEAFSFARKMALTIPSGQTSKTRN